MDGTINLPNLKIGVSLRTQVVILMLILLVGFVLLLYVLSQMILLDSFEQLEHELAEDDLQRLTNVLDNEFGSLRMMAGEWAAQDDTYVFLKDPDAKPAFVASNLLDNSFETLQLNLFLLIDNNGTLVYGKAYRLDEHIGLELNDTQIEQYLTPDTLRQYVNGPAGSSRSVSGLLISPRGPMMIAINPVVLSDGEGTPAGTLVMGRFLDQAVIARLASTIAADVALYHVADPDLPPDFQDARAQLAAGVPHHLAAADDTLSAYMMLDDISGQPALILRATIPRDIYREGRDTIEFFLLGLIAGGLLLVSGALFLLQRQVLARIFHMNDTVRTIGDRRALDRRVPVTGRDELSNLALSINGMLDAVQQSQRSLAESQSRTQQIVASISDVIYTATFKDGRVISHQIPSPQIAELTGYPLERFEQDWYFWQTLIHPDDQAVAAVNYDTIADGSGNEIEYRMIRADGTLRWVRDSAHGEVRDDGTVAVYGVVSDITPGKQARADLAQSERAAREFQQALKELLDVSVELTAVTTLEDLCRQAIVLGRERLGFDRIALFLLDDGGATMAGTFGVDAAGHYCDLRALRRPVEEDPAIATVLADRKWAHVWHDTPLYDATNEPAGRGWNAVASLWADNRALGWLAIDNLTSRAALKPYELELLSLYSTTVGHLITRVRAEAALRESEARHRALFENAHDAIFVMRESVFVDCNSRALALFGGERADLIGQSPYRFSPPRQPDGTNSREKARDVLKLALSGIPQTFEWRHVRLDGTPFDVEVSLSRMALSREMLVLAMVRDITERKRTEQALRESEERYSTLFYRVPVELYRTTPEGEMLDANPALVKMMGYDDLATMRKLNVRELYVNPDDRARWQAVIDAEGEVHDFELEMRRPDGSTYWVLDTAHAVRDEDGNTLYYEGSIRDITLRKRAEDELASERNLLRTLIDALPDRIYVKDTRGAVVLTNIANAQAMGQRDPDTVVGKTDFDVYPRELAERYNADDRAVIDGGEPLLNRIEPIYLDAQEEPRWLATTKVPLRDAQDRIIGLVGVGHDITAQRATQEALRQSRERLDMALQVAGLGMWDWYVQTGRVIFNERWAEISGHTLDELGAHSGVWETLVHPDDWPAVKAALDAHLAGETPIFECEYRMCIKSGEVKWVLDRGQVLHRDDDGTPLRMTGALLDITARKHGEAEREQLLQQMRTRATELASVADVSQQVTRILDVDPLLWTLCDLIQDHFALYHVQVYLLSADGQRLEFAAGYGEVGHRLAESGHYIPLEQPHSLVARAARDCAVVTVNDVADEADHLPNSLLPDTRSEMALPMMVGGTLIGVLDVQSDQVGRFSEDDIHIQTTLAAQVAIAIHNARLFTDNARRLAIIEHSHDAIALASADVAQSVPTYINPAGLRMLGYESLEDIRAHTVGTFYAPESRTFLRENVLPVVQDSGAWRGETVLQRHDGTQVPVEQTVFLIRDEQGAPRDLATIITDITERRQAENALRRANRAYRTLSECNQAMVGATDEVGLLRKICEIVVESGGYRMAWVGLVDEQSSDRALVHPVAHAGHEDGYLETMLQVRVHAGNWRGPARRALEQREPYVVRSMAEDADFAPWREQALARSYQSSAAVPLFNGDQALGTLNVYASTPNAFDEQEIALLRELASDLAYGIAVLRTRLERQAAVKQLHELNTQLTQRNRQLLALYDAGRTLNATLDVNEIYRVLYREVVHPVFGADALVIAAYDAANEQITCEFVISDGAEQDPSTLPAMSLGEGPNSATIRTGQPRVVALPHAETDTSPPGEYVHFGGEREPRSAMYIPLTASGAVTGVVNVQHYDDSAFDDYDVQMLSAIANQAAVAIQNARLFQAEREQRALAEALQAAVSAVNSTLDPDVVMDRILANIKEVVPHDAASIMLIEDGIARIVRHTGFAERGLKDYVESLRLHVGRHNLLHGSMLQGKPVLVTDTRESSDWIPRDEADWIRSYIGAPIIVGEDVVGILNLDSETPGFFTERHAHRAAAFAEQVAIAVQNAQLFAAEHEQRTLAEALQAITAAVNSTLDVDMVMDRILASLKVVVPNDAASIMLIEGDEARIARHIGFEERGLADFVNNMRFDVQKLAKFKQMAETRQPVRLLDTHESDEWAYSDELAWIRSYLGAPIIVGDTMVGVLNLDSAVPGFFTARHAERLQGFADQVAVAVHNARLFAGEREQRQFAESLRDIAATINLSLDPDHVLGELLANIKPVIPHDAATLMLIEGDTVRTLRSSGFEAYGMEAWAEQLSFDVRTHDVMQRIIHSGESVIINDTSQDPGWHDFPETGWQRACLTSPLRHEGQVIGFLNLYSTQTGFFTEQHAERLQAFAYHAANAIRNVQLFAGEREQRALAEALRDIIAAINSTLDQAQVMGRILANVERVVPHDAANIMLIEGGTAAIARARGYTERGFDDLIANWRHALVDLPLLHSVVESGQTLRVPDTAQDARWNTDLTPESVWIRATLKAPIQLGGEVIGVLNLDSETPGAFTEEHARQIQIFADYAAAAIRNARLFAAERERRALSDVLRDTAEAFSRTLDLDDVLDRILTNVGRVFPNDATSVMLIDEATGEAYVARHRGFDAYDLGDWITNRRFAIMDFADMREVVETGTPKIISSTHTDPNWIVLPQTDWIRAHATVPISQDQKVIGFLMLESTTEGLFRVDQEPVLRIFANQAAMAVQNARLYTAERDQRRFAEALRDTAAAINRTLEFDHVLDFVLANTQDVIPHDAANIMLIEDGVARVVRGQGYDRFGADEWTSQLRYAVKDVPVWHEMLATGKPFVIPDTTQNKDWLAIEQEAWIRSTVKAPIRVEGRVVGILHLDSATPDTFNQEHAERLQAFADQAAVALRNAEFFAAEHAQRTLAEALRDTAAAINSTLEFDEVLDRILYYVGRVVPYDSANLMLIEPDGVRIAAQYPEFPTEEFRQWRETFRFALEETANLKQMVATGKPVALPRIADYDGWIALPPFEWVASHAGAPIRLEGQVIGFITLDSSTPDFFTSRHAERLQAFADQAAIAIRNAQLFEAVQRHASELELRVAERTAEVEQRSAQMRAILDSITEGVLYDDQREVKYTNRALTRLTGYEADEFTTYLDILRSSRYSDDDYGKLIQSVFRTIAGHGVWQGDFWVRRKDRSEFEAALTVTEVRGAEGDMLGTVSVLRDVSQEKELQRQRDRFIASASHELRTPLTNFKTRLYLLKAQPVKAVEHLAILNRVANNMVDLVENLLDVSRFERGVIALRRRDVELQTLIREVVEVQRAEADAKDIALLAELCDEPLRVNVDTARMQQVITNLIANAVNYTSSGGTITVMLQRSGDKALLRVRDSGIGIEPEQIPRIFEPFFRANEEAAEGTGLGLTIAREIVRLHEGTINVTSAKGEGSTFTVELDLVQ